METSSCLVIRPLSLALSKYEWKDLTDSTFLNSVLLLFASYARSPGYQGICVTWKTSVLKSGEFILSMMAW